MVTRGLQPFQHKDGPFIGTGGHSMNNKWFSRELANGKGDVVNRTWLVYSPIKQAAYCFCCLLFSCTDSNSRSSFQLPGGFSNSKKTERVADHESSLSHHQSFNIWKDILSCDRVKEL